MIVMMIHCTSTVTVTHAVEMHFLKLYEQEIRGTNLEISACLFVASGGTILTTKLFVSKIQNLDRPIGSTFRLLQFVRFFPSIFQIILQ